MICFKKLNIKINLKNLTSLYIFRKIYINCLGIRSSHYRTFFLDSAIKQVCLLCSLIFLIFTLSVLILSTIISWACDLSCWCHRRLLYQALLLVLYKSCRLKYFLSLRIQKVSIRMLRLLCQSDFRGHISNLICEWIF